MSKAIGGESIWVIRPTGTANRHGERPSAEPERKIDGCAVWPRTSEETGEEIIVTGYNVAAPALSDIKATDRIKCRGEVWDIEGVPGDYRKKSGKPKAVLVTLKRVGT